MPFRSIKLRKYAIGDNVLSRLEKVETHSSDEFAREVKAERVSDISNNLGTMISGSFIAPASTATSVDPTNTGFTGAAMGGDGWTFGGSTYQFVGVAAGVLQAGIATDGKMYWGAGTGVMSADGIKILEGTGTPNNINWVTSLGATSSFIGGRATELQIGSSGNIGLASSGGGYVYSQSRFVAQNFFSLAGAAGLTIASGAITVICSNHYIDTQGGAGTDDLDTINGGNAGDLLILRTATAAHVPTIKDTTGNLYLAGDFVMDSTRDMIMLINVGGTLWHEICRSNNA